MSPGAGSGETRAEFPQSLPSQPAGQVMFSMPYAYSYTLGATSSVYMSMKYTNPVDVLKG